MQRFGTLQKPLLFTTLAISLTAPLALWMLSPWRPSKWLVNRLYSDLEHIDDDQLELPAKQLASVGEAGWPALVRGLQSNRPAVRAAADRAIREMIDSWQRLPAQVSAPRVMLLAQLLVSQLPAADSESLHASADLAERLSAWPSGGNDGMQLVYDCEQILRAARQAGWPKATIAEPAPQPPRLATRIPDPAAEPMAPPSTVDADPNEDLAIARSGEFGFNESTTADATDARQEIPSLGLQPVFSFVPPTSEPGQDSSENPSQTDAIVVEPPADAPPDWPTLDIHQVLRNWRDPAFKAAAEMELRRRGFDLLNLRVARIAADANAENRVKLIRLLPQLSGVNAAGWLLILARDESPSVRAAAVQTLSTATDPQILERLEKLEETETDAEVRAAIRKSRTANR